MVQDFVTYMMGKYFLIPILIGALLYGCEKPTGYTLDNKKDPENKDYIPSEPDSFIVFKGADKVPNLVWRDNSEAESGFLIKKKIGSAEFNLVESTTSNQSNWIDESYKPSEPILYGIQAYNDNGESDLVVTSPLLSFLSVDLEVNGSGKVSLINLAELPDSLLYGSELMFTAEPEDCWDFVSWNELVFELSNTYMVVSDTTIRVNFVENTIGYEIQINTSGQGEIMLYPQKAIYGCGDIVEIEAIPNEGWYFSGWSNQTTNQNPLKLKIGSNVTIDAVFTKIPDDLYYLHSNGSTVICDKASLGLQFILNGRAYTKRNKEQITTINAASTCTSGINDMSRLFMSDLNFNGDISHWDVSDVTDMSSMFMAATSFNQDISSWDVSNVTDMSGMFSLAQSFDQDISKWDVSNVEEMTNMLFYTTSFNQDLSGWCVQKISSKPSGFADYSALLEEYEPKWGTCPSE